MGFLATDIMTTSEAGGDIPSETTLKQYSKTLEEMLLASQSQRGTAVRIILI